MSIIKAGMSRNRGYSLKISATVGDFIVIHLLRELKVWSIIAVLIDDEFSGDGRIIFIRVNHSLGTVSSGLGKEGCSVQ